MSPHPPISSYTNIRRQSISSDPITGNHPNPPPPWFLPDNLGFRIDPYAIQRCLVTGHPRPVVVRGVFLLRNRNRYIDRLTDRVTTNSYVYRKHFGHLLDQCLIYRHRNTVTNRIPNADGISYRRGEPSSPSPIAVTDRGTYRRRQ